jgi:hypothetical protein
LTSGVLLASSPRNSAKYWSWSIPSPAPAISWPGPIEDRSTRPAVGRGAGRSFLDEIRASVGPPAALIPMGFYGNKRTARRAAQGRKEPPAARRRRTCRQCIPDPGAR